MFNRWHLKGSYEMDQEVFNLGLTLSLETYYKTYHTTQVLGVDKDVFIMTKAIYVLGKAVELQSDDTCTIRFLKEGVAYGFKSRVISVQFYPFPLMFIKYPDNIETVKLRVAPRFRVELLAKLLDAPGVMLSDAVLVDISSGGCRLRLPIQNNLEFATEVNYSISFTFVGKEFRLDCAVRRLEIDGEPRYLGMQFININEHVTGELTTLLDSLEKVAPK
jgi:c-di-GMP-binding flagellar brake protein YcgR